jgi:hypothetical protein
MKRVSESGRRSSLVRSISVSALEETDPQNLLGIDDNRSIRLSCPCSTSQVAVTLSDCMRLFEGKFSYQL